MAEPPPELILASTSPYRRALLERLGVPFRCVSPEVDESLAASALAWWPQSLAGHLADAKARDVARRFPGAVVIGGDQLATIDGEVLGKPGSEEGARAQLLRMQGRTHELITALCVRHPDGSARHTDVTRLSMRNLTEEAIARYVAADRPIDCAGSYKIEERGISLFERIETEDSTAITGMPLLALGSILRSLGYDIP